MKRIHKFFLQFCFLFITGLIFNAIFKNNLNVHTAFSVALGISLGMELWNKKAQVK